MPVKKFKSVLEPPPIPQSAITATSTSKTARVATRKGGTKPDLETPNLPLPAPTPEGPVITYPARATSGLATLPTNGTPKYNKDKLKDSWNSLSGQTMEYLLEVDPLLGESRLKTLLRETKLKDIGVLLGISTEKVLLMEGHIAPTMGQDEKRKLDEFLPEILKEIQRRGASCTVTERKAEIKLNGK